jgi:hypothetical protein
MPLTVEPSHFFFGDLVQVYQESGIFHRKALGA